MTQKERLLQLLKAMRYGQSKFEDEIGASRGAIAHMRDFVSPNFRAKIERRFPDVNVNWIAAGVGDMFNVLTPEEDIPQERKILLNEIAAQRDLMERLTTQMSRLSNNIDECQRTISALAAKL